MADWRARFAEPHLVDYPVVFVHGISGGYSNWEPTLALLSDPKFEMRFQTPDTITHNFTFNETSPRTIWNISYYTPDPVGETLGGDLSIYAHRLNQMLHLILELTEQQNIVIIAHSMGGIVARGAMIRDKKSWQSVHKILTVGSPNEGVSTAVGIIGQWRDLHPDSTYIREMNDAWLAAIEKGDRRWGVVGAVDIPENALAPRSIGPDTTDSGGFGYIAISSAIPFGEWRYSVSDQFNSVATNTEHFGFRLATNTHHDALLQHPSTWQGILWALSDN